MKVPARPRCRADHGPEVLLRPCGSAAALAGLCEGGDVKLGMAVNLWPHVVVRRCPALVRADDVRVAGWWAAPPAPAAIVASLAQFAGFRNSPLTAAAELGSQLRALCAGHTPAAIVASLAHFAGFRNSPLATGAARALTALLAETALAAGFGDLSLALLASSAAAAVVACLTAAAELGSQLRTLCTGRATAAIFTSFTHFARYSPIAFKTV